MYDLKARHGDAAANILTLARSLEALAGATPDTSNANSRATKQGFTHSAVNQLAWLV